MGDQVVTYELQGEVALIGLNRPEKRNALNQAVASQLYDAVSRALDEAKVGVLFGHGDHFSGGLDLAMFAETAATRRVVKRRPLGSGADLMARGDIPFIAAIRGAAIGWGLEVAACAHIRVADETAFFALPEGQRGIFVGGGGSVRVSRLMGVPRMMDMMLTGRVLNAAEAERCDVVQYLVKSGEALSKAKELAEKIAKNSPLSNNAIINGLPRLREMPYEEGLYFEALVAATTFGPEAAERIKAFVEKRAEKLAVPDHPERPKRG
ncbi:MAG: crotonase/enoyl-CoA hydratase family protein [Alphaproteobacteria bacterium]